MKKLIGVVVALVLALGGYMAYAKYEDNKFIEAMTPHVKKSSLHISSALRYETEEWADITFQELLDNHEVRKKIFDNLEGGIAEIDRQILEVRNIETPSNKNSAEPVLAYLQGGQELLRAQLSSHKKAISYQAVVRILGEKAGEELEAAHVGFLESSKKMVNLRHKAADVMPEDTLVDAAILDTMTKQMDQVVNGKKPAETQLKL